MIVHVGLYEHVHVPSVGAHLAVLQAQTSSSTVHLSLITATTTTTTEQRQQQGTQQYHCKQH